MAISCVHVDAKTMNADLKCELRNVMRKARWNIPEPQIIARALGSCSAASRCSKSAKCKRSCDDASNLDTSRHMLQCGARNVAVDSSVLSQ